MEYGNGFVMICFVLIDYQLLVIHGIYLPVTFTLISLSSGQPHIFAQAPVN